MVHLKLLSRGSLLKQHYAAELINQFSLCSLHGSPCTLSLHDYLKPDPVDAEPIGITISDIHALMFS